MNPSNTASCLSLAKVIILGIHTFACIAVSHQIQEHLTYSVGGPLNINHVWSMGPPTQTNQLVEGSRVKAVQYADLAVRFG